MRHHAYVTVNASIRSKAEGKLREVERALDEVVSAAARDRDLRIEARLKRGAGKVKGAVGRVQKAVGK